MNVERERLTQGEIAERVAEVVLDIPEGRVMTYGDIAGVIGTVARHVGHAMALGEASVPWWRVTNAAARLPEHLRAQALAEYRAEGTPVRDDRVDLRLARWRPEEAWEG